MKKTLLQKAKEVKVRSKKATCKLFPTKEGIELSFAWLRNEVGWSQMNVAVGNRRDNGNILYSIALWLREAYRQGKLKIKT